MSEQITITLILAVQGIIIALIGYAGVRLNKIAKDAKEAKFQVKNAHTTNLREELDTRHDETRKWFSALYAGQQSHTEILKQHGDKLDIIQVATIGNSKRISSLEDTK